MVKPNVTAFQLPERTRSLGSRKQVVVDWFLQRAGTTKLVNAYALTETCAGMTIGVDQQVADRTAWPVADVELRLIDGAGQVVETEGQLIMRSFGMMEGYLDRPDLTATKLRDGWLYTGDLVERRDDGYHILGRIGDRINRGGYKFDPIDVEDVATRVSGVTSAVACAIPHSVLGEDVALAVEVASGRDTVAVKEAGGRQAGR